MNDALDRREENGRPGRLDQVVFRWDGNQGRSNAGMAAVAHSCSAERAEALRRELGPLLWVPGSGPAPRPSSVRVPSRACGTVLLQRWPTLDLGGRPSTACHAVFGDADTLTPLLCLGLSGRAWSTPEAAESAVGGLPPLDGDRLRATAAARLREMAQDLPTVKKPLMVVVAEWLRDPSRRLSLLAEEHELPGWPRRNSAPLLYLGLLSVFGDWFGTEWSYATYDTVDTHDVRLTCVPGWSSQAAGARSLARVRLRLPAEGDLEMSAAKELVEYVLDHPGADPGVPHLTGDLLLGAGLPRQERRDALRRMLNTWLAPAPSLPPVPAPRPEGEEAWGREPERERERDRERGRHAQDRDRELREQRWEREPHDRERERELREQQDRERDRERERELREQQQDRERERHERERRERELRRLRDELLVHQRVNAAQSARLAARLMDLRDSSLLSLLRADELPWVSRDLVLAELARPDRRRSRDEATAHALCAEVLRHNLYFRPGRSEADGPSAAEMREHAADLFHWAVAPLAREPHHAPDLRPLFNVFLKDGRSTGMEWLRRVLVAPPGGRAPDLPPQLWQQVVTELLARPGAVPAPTTPPSPLVAASVAGPPAAPSPRTAPEPAVRTATPLSSTPTPTRPVRPATTDPAPRGDEPEKQGLLYRDSFLAAFAGVVGAIVIGILVLIIVN